MIVSQPLTLTLKFLYIPHALFLIVQTFFTMPTVNKPSSIEGPSSKLNCRETQLPETFRLRAKSTVARWLIIVHWPYLERLFFRSFDKIKWKAPLTKVKSCSFDYISLRMCQEDYLLPSWTVDAGLIWNGWSSCLRTTTEGIKRLWIRSLPQWRSVQLDYLAEWSSCSFTVNDFYLQVMF